MFRRCVLTAIFSAGVYLTQAAAWGQGFDPTRPMFLSAPPKQAPVAKKTVDKSAYRLSSLLIAAQRQVAVINDKAVGVGESVAGAKVLAIAADGVRLVVDGIEFSLTLATPHVDDSSSVRLSASQAASPDDAAQGSGP